MPQVLRAPTEAILGAAARGIGYLARTQETQGFWLDFNSPRAGRSSQWVTAYVARSLAAAREVLPFLDRAQNWLTQTRLAGPGWGYKTNFMPDADSTANAIRALAGAPRSNRPGKDLDRSLDFLATFQDPSTGGFATYRALAGAVDYMTEQSVWCAPETSVTAMAGWALLEADPGGRRSQLNLVRDFLLDRQTDYGYWESVWWETPVYAAGLAAPLLGQLGNRPDMERAAAWLLDCRDPAGGWGDGPAEACRPFATALGISLLLDSGQASRTRPELAAAARWLLDTQRPDGSWASSAVIREPEPSSHQPGRSPQRETTPTVSDDRRVFTTAAVTRALLGLAADPPGF